MLNIDNYFTKGNCFHLTENFFKAIGDDWLLITAGIPEKYNTMTASWGATGILWNKPIAICFIRPTRHTHQFAMNNDIFTLSFFTEAERNILQYCGSKSGKDVDKISATGLKPLITENKGITYEQSRLCFECKKIYYSTLNPHNFLAPDIDVMNYPKKDYHTMFIGEIQNCYLKK